VLTYAFPREPAHELEPETGIPGLELMRRPASSRRYGLATRSLRTGSTGYPPVGIERLVALGRVAVTFGVRFPGGPERLPSS